jgi:site-specific recombinase XerD
VYPKPFKINTLNQKIIKICEEKFIYLNYSPRTKDNYLCHIRDFLNTLNDKQIIHCSSKDFQFYLDNYKFTSVSQQNQVINTIRFLYNYGLDKNIIVKEYGPAEVRDSRGNLLRTI